MTNTPNYPRTIWRLTQSTRTFIRRSILVLLNVLFPQFCISFVSGPAGEEQKCVSTQLKPGLTTDYPHKGGDPAHLQTAPVRSTSRCFSACSLAAGSSHCPERISDRRRLAFPWSGPGGCLGVRSIPHLEGFEVMFTITTTIKVERHAISVWRLMPILELGDAYRF